LHLLPRHFNSVILTAFLCMIITTIFAQYPSNTRSKVFAVKADTIYLDSLSIIPGSVLVHTWKKTDTISPSLYSIDFAKSILVWKNKPQIDSIRISYRIFPYNFSASYFHKDFSRLNKRDSIFNNYYVFIPENSSADMFNFGGLNYNGSFSRGIAFGNSQDLTVNSNLNLQLSGKLNDVEVSAAVSDNNIPIQPEGNTQQLQDFDKVYIQLKRNGTTLIAGDFNLERPDSYFMNFSEKLEGASVTSQYRISNDFTAKTEVSGAISEGKFARNTFYGTEGNQGPYQLTGDNNETYIIIIAGSEKVYIDGNLMTRGDNQDYTIDYNAGQVTFTPNRLITKDSRIDVDFQYSDQNYLSTLFYVNQEFDAKNIKIKFNLYDESDDKNQPIQQTLTPQQEKLLASVGDSVKKAVAPSVDSTAYNPAIIQYKLIDTTIGSETSGGTLVTHNIIPASRGGITYDSVYVYSVNPANAFYTVNFSYVGQGFGDYVISNTVANGRVYYWVAPVNGVHQGAYIPAILLIAPQSKQMATVGVDYKITKQSTLSVEGSYSNINLNTFSTIDKSNDQGWAGYAHFTQHIFFDSCANKPISLTILASYEHDQKDFQALDPYRPVEFTRDWNIDSVNYAPTGQDLTSLTLNLNQGKSQLVSYEVSSYLLESEYTGINQVLNSSYSFQNFKLQLSGSLLNSQSSLQNTEFFRPTVDLSKMFPELNKIVVGAQFFEEDNRITSGKPDTLTSASFYDYQYEVYIHSADSLKNKFKLDFVHRYDFYPDGQNFSSLDNSNTLNLIVDVVKSKNSNLHFTFSYRQLSVYDTAKTTQKNGQDILGLAQYNITVDHGFLVSNTLYSVGSGLQQKEEYTFVQVPAGTGVYEWVDFNHDGIAELNEFIVAPYADEADYIKVYNPTNQFVKDYTVKFNELLSINPRVLFANSSNTFDKFLSRFSTQSSVQLNRQNLQNSGISPFNPFNLNLNDSVLISATANVSNNIYFNRISPKYEIDFLSQTTLNRAALTEGSQTQLQDQYTLHFRWNAVKKITLLEDLKDIRNYSSSELLSSDDYNVYSTGTETQIVFQPSVSFRTSLDYLYIQGKNYGDSSEYYNNNKISLDGKYTILSKSSVEVTLAYALVNYTGSANSPVQYAMLNGLQAGNNVLWTVEFDRKLSNFVQITLTYEGRKNGTGTGSLVNTGSAQVRATF
jgi:hypothetical protein